MAISVGAAAPDFTLKDQNQKEVKLSDYKGKKNVVLVFYPLDWSPVCTNEHACFVNDMKRFEQLDAQVLGVSVDSVWSHKAFADKMGIRLSACSRIFIRAAQWEISSEFISRTKASPDELLPLSIRSGNVAWFKNYDIPTVPDVNEVSSPRSPAWLKSVFRTLWSWSGAADSSSRGSSRTFTNRRM